MTMSQDAIDRLNRNHDELSRKVDNITPILSGVEKSNRRMVTLLEEQARQGEINKIVQRDISEIKVDQKDMKKEIVDNKVGLAKVTLICSVVVFVAGAFFKLFIS